MKAKPLGNWRPRTTRNYDVLMVDIFITIMYTKISKHTLFCDNPSKYLLLILIVEQFTCRLHFNIPLYVTEKICC